MEYDRAIEHPTWRKKHAEVNCLFEKERQKASSGYSERLTIWY